MEKLELLRGISAAIAKKANITSNEKTELNNKLNDVVGDKITKETFFDVAKVIKENLRLPSGKKVELINELQSIFSSIEVKENTKKEKPEGYINAGEFGNILNKERDSEKKPSKKKKKATTKKKPKKK